MLLASPTPSAMALPLVQTRENVYLPLVVAHMCISLASVLNNDARARPVPELPLTLALCTHFSPLVLTSALFPLLTLSQFPLLTLSHFTVPPY